MSQTIKSKLLEACLQHVEQRISNAMEAMHRAQESANTEEKSSAGDKYETGRAMAQLERDKAAQQLDDALQLKAVLQQIQTKASTPHVAPGSLVLGTRYRFFIAISLGKLTVEGLDYFVVSAHSPVGQSLLSRKVSDSFHFNNQPDVIREIL